MTSLSTCIPIASCTRINVWLSRNVMSCVLCIFGRDDVEHPGKSIAWGRWAITHNDPEFRGKGASDSGDDYGPAPGRSFGTATSTQGWHDFKRFVLTAESI